MLRNKGACKSHPMQEDMFCIGSRHDARVVHHILRRSCERCNKIRLGC